MLPDKILELSDEKKIKLARNPNTSPKTLKVLATDKNYDVRCGVARNPNTSQESLAVLATDKYFPYVCYCVAHNPNTSVETLNVLATDKDWYVRHSAAKNLNATEITRRLVLMTNEQNS